MQILGKYQNGNYDVTIYADGTKVRETHDPAETDFIAAFPESIDMKLTNRCDRNCPWCHEDSAADGDQAELFPIPAFIDTLRPWTEIALGGGSLFCQSNLEEFLRELRKRDLIPNITVNQHHFMRHQPLLKKWADEKLIYGIGVSLTEPTDEFIETVKQFPNAVVHVINGIVKHDDIRKLKGYGLKILILGYKMFRRGETYYNQEVSAEKEIMRSCLPAILTWFKVVSFDNLALEQLGVQNILPKEIWDKIYMGDDGQHTMYLDLVKREYALNSTSKKRFPITDDIVDMFQHVKTLGK